ncbi:oxygenase MpaB family protein [Aquabacterium sp. J223]|uniref:oxygenase MpaB family protein n=1 Tax=Aquabacterium sp. J223 TaxID=2898431 RepID=UPI0021ADE51F|nr:oxygenase MpaB family protein [Aquabacterium sp. J223]UUX97216.1 oxygenase MpaB family protein [Aquabacterium sp. J223]
MSSSVLARPLLLPIDRAYARFLQPAGTPTVDFAEPRGEPALCPADGVSWRVCKNPVTLTVGGIAAVLLELAEPRVRSGVWGHSNFRDAPVRRLQRTGLATLVTVYGPRSRALRLVDAVHRAHATVRGITPDGIAYDAREPELLDWVQATAAIGFVDAWQRWVRPLSAAERDRYLAEGAPAARLYGATAVLSCEADWPALLDRMLPRLRPSPVLHEFLAILRAAPLLPAPLKPLQSLLIQGALQQVPAEVRRRTGLQAPAMGRGAERLLRGLARTADRLCLPSSPPVQACRRLGLPATHLYPGVRGSEP